MGRWTGCFRGNLSAGSHRACVSAEEVSSIVSRISREAEGLSKRVYYEWQREGIERLEDALEKAYQDLQAGTPIEVILPALGKHGGRIQPIWEVSLPIDRQPLPDFLPSSYVERPRELGKLREAIASVAEKGGWVSVEGLPGIGKSTLVRALIRQFTEEAAFPGNLWEVAYAQSEVPVHLENSHLPDDPLGRINVHRAF